MKAMTIDRLLLSTLAEGRPITADSLSGRWGEDKARVIGWLERFRRQGLVAVKPRPARSPRPDGGPRYVGKRAMIAAYLETSDEAA